MNKRLHECQFTGYIGTNRYAYRAFHDKILGGTKFMLYVRVSIADGWKQITEERINGYLDAEDIRSYAEREVHRIEAL